MGVRRRARECALKILFAREVSGVTLEEAIESYWDHFDSREEGREYAEILARGTSEHIKEIDQTIQGISAHWKIARMACVDRNILRIATFELLYLKDVPKRVALNEAIEIAKKFGSEDSWAFINGILDKLETEPEPEPS